uniref:Uncharacterized protein n=1 Tax=Onchocerca volvulus TaxID=6282 RepID=A0A8R1XYD4_ONCVO
MAFLETDNTGIGNLSRQIRNSSRALDAETGRIMHACINQEQIKLVDQVVHIEAQNQTQETVRLFPYLKET